MTRRALVTGFSKGLGAHLAKRLSEDGWEVLGVARTSQPDGAPGMAFRSLQIDLAEPAAVAQVVEWCGTCPELVVHNAVAYPSPALIATPDVFGVERVFRVNAIVPYLLTRSLLDQAREGTFTTVVMINSEVMFHASADSGIYAAGKAANRVFATSLADACRSRQAAVSTLLLGPLADEGKLAGFCRLAESKGIPQEKLIEIFLRKSNPDLTITRLIDLEACYRSIQHMVELGHLANGMLCRLDGGSAGSLI